MAWECSCGNIEYGEMIPQECSSCFAIDSFTPLPEELMDERARDADFDDEIPVKAVKAKAKTSKAKAAKSKSKSAKAKTRSSKR